MHLKWPAALAASILFCSTTLLAAEGDKPKEKKEQKPFEVAKDWKVETILEYPDIKFPSVVCAAPDGRIFIAEDPMDMIADTKEPIDRILCVHPDGKVNVFADKLYAVFGITYIDGKIYVHHCPRLSVFTDKDSVGTDRKDLIDTTNPSPGGGGTFNDHIPANIHLAMDGYLYMAVGDKGIYNCKSNVDGRTAELRGGGLLRIRPDGTGLEVYATGTRNHLDVSINAEDEMFTYDNTDDGIGWWTRFTHMVDSGYYGYPHDYRPLDADKAAMEKYKSEKGANPDKPWTLWRAAEYGGGSPCGAIAYNEEALPEKYRGNLFHCEWGKGTIERFEVKRDGGTYKVVTREIMLKGGPGSLRPVGICVTPDGTGFYIADWNNSGWKSKTAACGRLLKLTYTGADLKPVPKPAWYAQAAMGQEVQVKDDQWIEGLKHPAESVRLVAQRNIHGWGRDLLPLISDVNAPDFARWHAIWAYARLNARNFGKYSGPGPTCVPLANLLNKNTNASVRRQILRALASYGENATIPQIAEQLVDTDASIRFHAATALGRMENVEATTALMRNLSDKDLFSHFATFTALHKIGMANTSAWKPISAALGSAKKEEREGVALAMRNAYDEALVAELAAIISDKNDAEAKRAAALEVLAPLARKVKPWDGRWWGTQPQRSGPPARDQDWAGTKAVFAALLGALDDARPSIRNAAIKGLIVSPDASAGSKLAAMFVTETAEADRKDILRALAASKSPAAVPIVVDILKNREKNSAFVLNAIEIASSTGGKELLAALLDFVQTNAEKDYTIAALKALAKNPSETAVPVLIKKLAAPELLVAIAAAQALGANKGKAPLDALVSALKDERIEVAKASTTALGAMKVSETVVPLMEAAKNSKFTDDAILALTQKPDIRAIDLFLDGLSSKDGKVREGCKNAVRNVKGKALPLIEARLEKEAFALVVINELKNIYKDDDAAHKGKLFTFDTKSLSPEAYEAFAQKHSGDAKKGEKVFKNKDMACLKCHKVGNEGADIGPSLASVGTKYDRAFLMDSILHPSKQVLDGYHLAQLKLTDGTIATGLVKGETETELTLVDSAAASKQIKKSDIAKRGESKLSLMPDGLQATMTPDEFVDLVAYLQSLKEPIPATKKDEKKDAAK